MRATGMSYHFSVREDLNSDLGVSVGREIKFNQSGIQDAGHGALSALDLSPLSPSKGGVAMFAHIPNKGSMLRALSSRVARVDFKVSFDEAMELGRDFIGEIGRINNRKDGSIREIYSADGLRRFRTPVEKDYGGMHSNFETLKEEVDPTFIKGGKNPWKNNKNYTNTHLEIER